MSREKLNWFFPGAANLISKHELKQWCELKELNFIPCHKWKNKEYAIITNSASGMGNYFELLGKEQKTLRKYEKFWKDTKK